MVPPWWWSDELEGGLLLEKSPKAAAVGITPCLVPVWEPLPNAALQTLVVASEGLTYSGSKAFRQVGCYEGKHLVHESPPREQVVPRWDLHSCMQTASV